MLPGQSIDSAINQIFLIVILKGCSGKTALAKADFGVHMVFLTCWFIRNRQGVIHGNWYFD